MELWAQLKNEDWSYVTGWVNWPMRLWNFDKHYQYIGRAGGEGVGYHAPASVGAALANKKYGRISVSIQPDGDLMVAPGALWTAARHQIPILIVMQNNRAYHQEVMWFQREALSRGRSVELTQTGFGLGGPDIDYAKMAASMGVASSGPITDPKDLAARDQARPRRREARRAVPDRRRDATAVTGEIDMKRLLIAVALLGCGLSTLAQQTPSTRRPSAAHGREVFLKLGCFRRATARSGRAAPARCWRRTRFRSRRFRRGCATARRAGRWRAACRRGRRA